MGILLTEQLESTFAFKDRIAKIDLSFDNVLLLYEMFDDEDVPDEDKPFIALEMLIENYEKLDFGSPEEEIAVFKFVLKEFLEIDLDASPSNGEGGAVKKVYDFKKDAELIYASFLNYYNIDLFEQQGKLHWKKFNALLGVLINLADKSPFTQVVGYRNMKLPAVDKHNKDEVARIKQMKRIYALEDAEVQASKGSGMDTFAQAMINMAKGK